MKRFAIAALAMALAAPAIPTTAAAQRYDRDRDRHWDRDHDDDDDRNWRDRRDRRDWRRDRRDRREARRWYRQRHNGYTYRGRWHYGPPPQAYYYDPYFEPGYRAWRRGDRLPSYYRESYYVVRDYDRYGLRRPPRGYHYVRDDRGDYLLVGIATGVILGVILANSGY